MEDRMDKKKGGSLGESARSRLLGTYEERGGSTKRRQRSWLGKHASFSVRELQRREESYNGSGGAEHPILNGFAKNENDGFGQQQAEMGAVVVPDVRRLSGKLEPLGMDFLQAHAAIVQSPASSGAHGWQQQQQQQEEEEEKEKEETGMEYRHDGEGINGVGKSRRLSLDDWDVLKGARTVAEMMQGEGGIGGKQVASRMKPPDRDASVSFDFETMRALEFNSDFKEFQKSTNKIVKRNEEEYVTMSNESNGVSYPLRTSFAADSCTASAGNGHELQDERLSGQMVGRVGGMENVARVVVPLRWRHIKGSPDALLKAGNQDQPCQADAELKTQQGATVISPARMFPTPAKSYREYNGDDSSPAVLVSSAKSTLDSTQPPPTALTSYLSKPLCEIMERMGMPKDMYPWQAECLTIHEGILYNDTNLLVSAPTSGGKTLIAEILMLRAIANDPLKRKALFVLPYVALCKEKADKLAPLLEPLQREVKEAFGGHYSGQLLESDTGVIVCTPENANSIINRMLDAHMVLNEELCCIVVDELHMVGSKDDRGTLLELLLTKVKYYTSMRHDFPSLENGRSISPRNCAVNASLVSPDGLDPHRVQIVGITATCPNIKDLANWLGAVAYVSNFRPVPLNEYIKVGLELQVKQENGSIEAVRKLPEPEFGDYDHIGFLAKESVDMGKSVLIFCATKKSTIEEAVRLMNFFQHYDCSERSNVDDSSQRLDERSSIANQLRSMDLVNSSLLADLVLHGISYHNADLVDRERMLVQEGYNSGAIKVLCSTSTVSTGINMPVHRVIFKHAYQRQPTPDCFLTASQYRQMSGRAGRAGVENSGESILVHSKHSKVPLNHLCSLVTSRLEDISSGLVNSDDGIKRMLLEIIGTSSGMTHNQLMDYTMSTLMYSCGTKEQQLSFIESVKDALSWLGELNIQRKTLNKATEAMRMIEYDPGPGLGAPGKFVATAFGKAVLVSGLTPFEALVLRQDLWRAQESFVMTTDLHACFLCAPLHMDLRMSHQAWFAFWRIIQSLDNRDQHVIRLVGTDIGYIQNRYRNTTQIQPDKERLCQRVYAAFILQDLIQEHSVKECMEKFCILSGQVMESLQENASKFAAKGKCFCDRLHWPEMGAVLDTFGSRVWFGAKADVITIAKICGITTEEARLLSSANLSRPEDISRASLEMIADILSGGVSHRNDTKSEREKMYSSKARQIRALARNFLMEQGGEVPPNVRALASSDLRALTVITSSAKERTGHPKDHPKPSKLLSHVAKPQRHKRSERPKTKDVHGFEEAVEAIRSGQDIGLHLDLEVRNANLRTAAIDMPRPKLKKQKRDPSFSGTRGDALLMESVKGLSIAWREQSSYIPFESLENEARQEIWLDLAHAFQQRKSGNIASIGWKTQNDGLFAMLAKHGVAVDDADIRAVDVRIGAWMLEPDSPDVLDGVSGHSSKYISKKTSMNVETNARSLYVSAEKILKLVRGLAESRLSQVLQEQQEMDKGLKLSAKISSICLDIYRLSVPLLEQENLMEPLMNIEMPICYHIGRMERWGVGIDANHLDSLKQQLLASITRIENQARRVAGKVFDLTAPKQVGEILFKHLGLVAPPCAERSRINKKGQKVESVSTDKDVLAAISDKHVIVPMIQNSRRLRDSLGYVKSLLGCITKGSYGSTVHGQILQTCASSGRLAMEDPNLQCLPKTYLFHDPDEQYEVNIRNSVIPVVAERFLLSADFRHIELRLMAHLSQDATLIDMLRMGSSDPFRLLARKWLRIPDGEEVLDEQRQQVKALTYGLCYGMGAARLGESLGVSPREATKLKNEFLDSFPGLSCWIKRVIEDCRQIGYILTLHKRRRWLPDINSEQYNLQSAAERAAVNTVCQGSAADVAKAAMLKVERKVKEKWGTEWIPCVPILQIHDEILFEVDPSELYAVRDIIKEAMESVGNLSVPLQVQFRVGPAWGSLKEIEN